MIVVQIGRERRLPNIPQCLEDEALRSVSSLRDIRFLRPDGKPNPEWRIFYGNTWNEARAKALESAEPKHPGMAIETARSAAWSAAIEEARVAAWDRISDMAKAAVNDAMARLSLNESIERVVNDAKRDAKLMSVMKIVRDVNLKSRYFEHAEKRMEVWRKGYALLDDVNSMLYVYAKGAQQMHPVREGLRDSRTHVLIWLPEAGIAGDGRIRDIAASFRRYSPL